MTPVAANVPQPASLAVVAMPDGEERIALAYERTRAENLFVNPSKTVELIMLSRSPGGAFGRRVVQTLPDPLDGGPYRVAVHVVLGPAEAEAALGVHAVDVFWLEFDREEQVQPRQVRLRHRTYAFGGGCLS